MFGQKDNTFNNIQDGAYRMWLDEMEQHPDVAVRGGVKLARDYVEYLKSEIERLKSENELKNSYLKKMRLDKNQKESK